MKLIINRHNMLWETDIMKIVRNIFYCMKELDITAENEFMFEQKKNFTSVRTLKIVMNITASNLFFSQK